MINNHLHVIIALTNIFYTIKLNSTYSCVYVCIYVCRCAYEAKNQCQVSSSLSALSFEGLTESGTQRSI